MFNKEKCKTCQYHSSNSSFSDKRIKRSNIYCNYASITGRTALRRAGNSTIDTRGYDHNNCLKYKKGKPLQNKQGIVI